MPKTDLPQGTLDLLILKVLTLRRASVYTLTPAGRRRLQAETASWEQFALSVRRILQAEA